MAAYLSIVAFAVIFAIVFLKTPARVQANFIKTIIPMALVAIGVALIVAKQFLPGTVIFFAGISLWKRMRGGAGATRSKSGAKLSSVRSAAFEMEVDQNQTALNGIVLVGSFEGRILDELSLTDLLVVRGEVIDDDNSLSLLDTYLDGRFSAWREHA